uniref:Huntingtin interacting protein 1 n=1 Tax=Scleropages formosus TaxID=113540 RepID=A0A8C9SX78_SCLFO
MDRVKSSIQQVSNPIPKGLIRRPGASSLELEKENFERSQTVSINKAINTQEVAVKEKHARNILLGAHTFWAAANRLPLSSNAVLCWKFCHVFHKLLRDGHPNVIKDSMRNKADLSDMSRMWVSSIARAPRTGNPRFPGNLQMTDRQLEEAGENDVNNFFQLTVEMFDYLECELNLFLAVFSSLDMSRSVSVTAAGQCRLAPLIQVILDCSHLYDYTVKLLFKLHSCLPADTLQGHRDRFQEQFKKLKNLFYRSSNLQYFKRLIQIPQLPENPPNFLRASALSEHISPVVVIPLEASSPESENVVETEELVDTDTALCSQSAPENRFDDVFGTSSASDPFNFNNQNGMYKDERDSQIEQLTREVRALKEELESFKMESSRLCQSLRSRVSELEAELEEQSHLKQQALGESEFLRAELEDLRRVREDTEKEQRSLTEIERRAQANEQRYTKLKEKYTALVQSHADLLRKNAEVTRQMTVARAAQDEVECVRKEMEEQVKAAQGEAGATETPNSTLSLAIPVCSGDPVVDVSAPRPQEKEQEEQVQTLQEELQASREELERLKESVASSQQVGPGDTQLERLLQRYLVSVSLNLMLRGLIAFSPLIAQELRPRGLELQQGELGDLVEQEMAATSAAVESAAARIEVRNAITPVECELMEAIKELVLSSKDLQRDIVESGRGAASMKEFYAKNSRWTEGLISASKAVGWGATVMVDAADLVVQGQGKFEELMVCSHEIAASTAQLVAASKVSHPSSRPRAANPVAAPLHSTCWTCGNTEVDSRLRALSDTMDFSSMTLTQIKRQEMDSQVRVLELETWLQKERERLGELRKKHYELAGVAEGWDEEEGE